MSEQIANSATKGEFFAVCIDTVKGIVRQGGMFDEVISYMILARHTQGRGEQKHRFSTAGANAIASKGGMTYRSAEKKLAWLGDGGFISNYRPDQPVYLGKGKGLNRRVRWQLNMSDNPSHHIYLAHSLFDGVGKGKENPPLSRIKHETQFPSGIPAGIQEARLDSIMLLLHMYQHQDIAECGGIDPRIGLYREWENTELPEVLFEDDLPFGLQEIQGGRKTMFTSFAKEAIFYIEDEKSRHQRFWHAFENLHRLGFLYEVLEIWDSNPLENSRAEPVYPLYVFDRHVRESKSEPFLAYEIHKAILESGAAEGMARIEFFEYIHFNRASGDHSFRYVIPKQGGYPLSVYRLRFRPKTRDTGIGMEAEKNRAEGWLNAIKSAI